ncbi:MAG: wax ester/triacylglycerol synthase domain-containing protein [Betaproteobacteria bacterium]
MHHLSALDALFLHLETPDMPMHVGSLSVLEKPQGHRGSFYKNIRDHIESRMHLAPLFSRRLAFMPLDLANPIWLNGSHVDLDDHIENVMLPKPGTPAQLDAMVAKLHEGMFDRDKPLWKFYVIEGLKDGSVAFYSRIHHAALDGQGGVALAQAILDTDPTPRRVEPAGQKARGHLAPTTAKMLGAAFRNTVAQYGKILKAVPEVAKLAGMAGAAALSSSQAKKAGAPSEQGTGIPELAGFNPGDSPEKAAKSLLKKIPGGVTLGPRTPLSVAISGKRAFAGVQLSLAESKALARHFEAKLNDIVLAVCAGALRAYFAGDKTALAKSMVGAVPASLRVPGDTSQSNQVTMMLVNMGTHIADPRKRLAAIVTASTRAKMLTGSMKSIIPTDMPSLGIPWLMSVITPLYKMAVAKSRIPVVANVVVSNVPGPQMPLYIAGALMKSYYPVSIVTHGLALNITIQSYAGSLDYGLIACKQAVPDLPRFAACMRVAHEELVALMQADVTEEAAPAAKAAPVAKKKTAAKKKPAAGPAAKVAKRKPVAATTKTAKRKLATTKKPAPRLTAAKPTAKKKRA